MLLQHKWEKTISHGIALTNNDAKCTNSDIPHINYHVTCIEIDMACKNIGVTCNYFSKSHIDDDEMVLNIRRATGSVFTEPGRIRVF